MFGRRRFDFGVLQRRCCAIARYACGHGRLQPGRCFDGLSALESRSQGRRPRSQVNLGYLFARGQGVAADQLTAFRLYSLSAAQGDGEGMNGLGYKYQFGTGVPKDIDMAVHWYCKAVGAGNARGMNNLAILLSHGQGVPRDEEQPATFGVSPPRLDTSTLWPT
jgi:TPR repeat protein